LELPAEFGIFRQSIRQFRELRIAQVVAAATARLHRFPNPLSAGGQMLHRTFLISNVLITLRRDGTKGITGSVMSTTIASRIYRVGAGPARNGSVSNNFDRKWPLALASRLITVPIGKSSLSEISRYEHPSK
jgi:hypothetical protein